jgi:hypothetical protein
MNKGAKIVGYGLLAGGVAAAVYFIRQAKLLKEICVKSTYFDWNAIIYDVGSNVISGDPITDVDIPFDLELSNSSAIDITIKEIDLIVKANDTILAKIYSESNQLIPKKSSSKLEIFVDANPELTQNDLTELLGSGLLGGTGLGNFLDSLNLIDLDNDIVFSVDGNIKLKASIFETYNLPYYMRANVNELLEEKGGNCK